VIAAAFAPIAPPAPARLPLDPGALVDVEALLAGLRLRGVKVRAASQLQADEKARRILAGTCAEVGR
jgi:hypothetical protein